MTKYLNELEQKSIRLALRGNQPWVKKLADQIPFLIVEERVVFDVGYVAKLKCGVGCVPIEMVDRVPDRLEGYPPSVNAEIVGVPGSLVSFLIWVSEDGYIQELDVTSLVGHSIKSMDISCFHNFQDDNGFPVGG